MRTCIGRFLLSSTDGAGEWVSDQPHGVVARSCNTAEVFECLCASRIARTQRSVASICSTRARTRLPTEMWLGFIWLEWAPSRNVRRLWCDQPGDVYLTMMKPARSHARARAQHKECHRGTRRGTTHECGMCGWPSSLAVVNLVEKIIIEFRKSVRVAACVLGAASVLFVRDGVMAECVRAHAQAQAQAHTRAYAHT